MAKNRNTFAKRQRQEEKKRKAQDKRTRRLRRKESPMGGAAGADVDSSDQEAVDRPEPA